MMNNNDHEVPSFWIRTVAEKYLDEINNLKIKLQSLEKKLIEEQGKDTGINNKTTFLISSIIDKQLYTTIIVTTTTTATTMNSDSEYEN